MSYNYNIEKSIVDTGLPTTYRSLDPNSPQNQQLTEADVLAAKSAMQKLLNEVQIRFDNDPKFLTKRDFGKLIELLQSSFGWLYSVPQFKQIIDDWEDLIKNDSTIEDKEIQLPSAQLVYESIKEMGSYIDLYVNNIYANKNEVNEWYNMFVSSDKLPYWDGEHNTRFTFNGNPKLVEVETDKYGILLTDADDSITWYQQGNFAWEYNIEVLDNGLHLSDSKITIDGVSYTAKDGVVKVELNPGQHTVRCGEYECIVTKIWSNATNYEIYVQDPLILYRDPELDMEAATKQYVDNCVSNYSPEAGRNIQIDKNQGEQGKDYIHALGYKWDKDRQSFAIGEQGSNGNIASGNYSFAEGLNAIASGQGSSSQGYNTSAQGQYSHAEGYRSITGGTKDYNDLQEGPDTNTSNGAYAHAEGNATIARGNSSHSEGKMTFADGIGAHAEGAFTRAVGTAAHAEGQETQASASRSHAEGMYTEASAQGAHAAGYYTTASGEFSHSEGSYTAANAEGSHAEGKDCETSKAVVISEFVGYVGQRYSNGYYLHPESVELKSMSDSDARAQKIQVGDVLALDEEGKDIIGTVTNITTSPWRSLNYSEWSYLINSRSGASQRKGLASVDGINGLILLDDDCPIPFSYNGRSFNYSFSSFNNNVITSYDWNLYFKNRAVFLPASGYRDGSSMYLLSRNGCYWSATECDDNAYFLLFDSDEAYMGDEARCLGHSVRLARPNHAENATNCFSVGYNSQVYLADSNLQYNPAQNEWRFAENPWDFIGAANQNISPSYDGWIDLFGWGTGDNPTKISTTDADYTSFTEWPGAYMRFGFLLDCGDKGWAPDTYRSCWKIKQAGSEASYSHAEGNNTKTIGEFAHSEGDTTIAAGVASHAEGEGNYITLCRADGDHINKSYIRVRKYSSYGESGGVSDSSLYGGSDSAGIFMSYSDSDFSYSDFQGEDVDPTTYKSYTGEKTAKKSIWIGRALYNASGNLLGYIRDVEPDAFTLDRQITIYNDNPIYILAGAYGQASHSEGKSNDALGNYSHAEGENTASRGTASHAEGARTVADGMSSHAEGYRTEAIAHYSHTEGFMTHAEGEYGHAEGEDTKASGRISHAEGYKTNVENEASHAEGSKTHVEGMAAHAEGVKTHAKGHFSHTEGMFTKSRHASHAEGVEAKADGFGSHAEGYKTIAGRINEETLIEQSVDLDGGFKDGIADIDKVLAIQSFAHAEGIETTAYTRASHTEGIDTLTDTQTLEDSRTSYIGYSDAQDKTLDYARYHSSQYHELNLRGYYITPRCYYATSGVDGLDANKLASSGLTYIPVQNGTNALLVSKEDYYDTSSIISRSNVENPDVLYIQVIGDLYSPTITSSGSNTITIKFNNKNSGDRTGYIYISSFLTSDLSYSASFSQNYSCNYSTETVLGTSTSSVLKDQSVIRFRINPTTTQYISGTVCTLTLTLSRRVDVKKIPDYTYYNFESDFGYSSSYSSAERKETIIYNAPKYLIGSAAHAEGISTEVKATAAHAEGYKSKALGEGAHAEGFDTKALAPYSHTSGFKTITDGDFSTAIGVKSTTGKTEWKYVELPWFKTDTVDSTQAGIYTTEWNRDDLGVYYSSNHTNNSYSYAAIVFPEGREFKLLLWNEGEIDYDYIEYTDINSETYDNDTEEIGKKEVHIQVSSKPQVVKLRYKKDESNNNSVDRGFFSIMELYHFGQLATGISTHAEGYGSTSTGIKTSANGVGSFTQGIGTQATGVASIAAGYQTIASGDKQVVVGKYNEETDAAFVIGNGTEDNRRNAFVVHWDGRVSTGEGDLVTTDIIETTSEAIGILHQEVNSLHNQDIILDEAIGMLHQKITSITEEQINSIFNLLNQ